MVVLPARHDDRRGGARSRGLARVRRDRGRPVRHLHQRAGCRAVPVVARRHRAVARRCHRRGSVAAEDRLTRSLRTAPIPADPTGQAYASTRATTQLPPRALASYTASSAARTSASGSAGWPGFEVATPKLAVAIAVDPGPDRPSSLPSWSRAIALRQRSIAAAACE